MSRDGGGARRRAGIPPLVEPGPPLDPAAVTRYSRHLLLPQIGELGQRRLRNARVAVIGAGGLGAPVLLYLAAAGVGRLGVVDDDDVDLSNLQRQVIHTVGDLGRPKVASAGDAVRAVNPGVEVVEHRMRLAPDTLDVLDGYDLVVDGTDNFATRYVVNDACVARGLPEVWGSVFRFDAQVSVFWGTPPQGVPPVQLRDLFPSPPPAGSVPSCAEGGVLGAMCGQVGTVMATEAVKLITGTGRPLLGRVLVLDALAATWREIALRGTGGRREKAGRPAEQASAEASGTPRTIRTVSAPGLRELQESDAPVLLVDVREPTEREIVTIPGAVGVPLGEVLAGRGFDGVPRDEPVVLYCRSGVRSEQAARALLAQGFTDVRHLAGGVLAWAEEVDPSLPRY